MPADPFVKFLQKCKQQHFTRSDSSVTICMGNEAGDLDSLASALAFAYFNSLLQPDRTYLALFQQGRDDFALRPENMYALERAHVGTEDVITLDDLDRTQLLHSEAQYALVDHNSIANGYIQQGQQQRVTAILDHHQDEGRHLDANPRCITMDAGSCASIVTNHFSNIFGKEAFTERLPDSLRLLLVAAILIDTGNLKPAPSGKATHRDRQAMATLTSSQQIQEPMISSSSDDLFTRLREAKSDVSSLSLRNHFRRDYKLLVTSNGCTVGLSSALLSLQELAAKDGWPGLARALLDWAQERSLDVAAVLTNFRRDGKSKRELLFLPKAEALRDILLQLPTSRSNGVADLRLRLWSTDDLDQYGFIVFDQLNDKATRKQVSPAVRAAIEDTYGARQL